MTTQHQSPLPELLAPAGGMEQLQAALRFGADAVYGGMASYGLRASATNFSARELASAINLTHAQGKKFYVTMNLLPFDRDMDGFLTAAWQGNGGKPHRAFPGDDA